MNIPVNLDEISLDNNPTLFADVGFCVSGSVDPRITRLLESAGAKLRSYAGVATTHFIAAQDADEMKVEEARDIFEVPVVTPDWAVVSAILGKVMPVNGFERFHKQLFSSVIITTSGISGRDLKSIWANVTYYGGGFRKNLTSTCTHLITNSCTTAKYKAAKEKGQKIVSCDWIIECIKTNCLLEESRFDPQLLIVPQNIRTTPLDGHVQQHMISTPQHQVRLALQSPQTQSQPQIHFQVVQQSSNRPPMMMGQMQARSQFQQPQPEPNSAGNLPINQQTMFRQQQNQNQMPLFHPIQQQRMQTSNQQLQSEQIMQQTQQQQVQNQVAPQQIQTTSPQQQMPNQAAPQQIQNTNPQQQMPTQVTPQQIQNTSPQQQMPTQVTPQQIQNTSPQQMIQNQVSQQQMQSQPNPQQIQSQPNTQQMQNQPSSQQLQNQGSQLQFQQQQIQGQMQYQTQNLQQMQFQAQSPIKSQQQQFGQVQQHMISTPQHQVRLALQSPQTQNQQQIHFQVVQQSSNRPPMMMGQMQARSQFQQPQQESSTGNIPINQQTMFRQPQTQSQIQLFHPIQQQRMQTSNQQLQSQQIMQQNQVSQQQMPNQAAPQQIQNTSPQQMIQNQVSQQQMQSQPNPQQIQSQPNTQQMQNQPSSQQLQNQGPPLQFQQQQIQGQMQYQTQNLQQMQFQAQSPIKSQQQQFGQVQQHMISTPQHQVRLALQSPQTQNQQQIHFQVVQQSSNRPPMMMGQMQARSQFQQPQQVSTQGTSNIPMNQQTMFRQQQSQIQLFHPIQQQRMQQSPSPNQQQQQQGQGGTPQTSTQMQGQMQPQQGQQHYNMVLNQQFPQGTPTAPTHPQQVNHQLQSAQQQQHVIQKVQFQTRGNSQWTQAQQVEIVRQIQLDPQIKLQWGRMDNQQRALLVQKLAQRNREEHLRREMMLRQQHMSQQSSTSPQQGTQLPSSPNQQQVSMSGNQVMGGQQSPLANHQAIQSQPEKQITQSAPPGHPSANQVSSLSPSQVHAPLQGPLISQPQILLQDMQNKSSPSLVLPNQVIVQNHQPLVPQSQQKVMNSQASPGNQQKFLAPAPVQNNRPQPHGIISSPQQAQQGTGVVRTQQIFTPQVGQQQQRVNVRHVLLHPSQQSRPPVVLQQPVSSQKMAILQGQQNQPLPQPGNQWSANQPRMATTGTPSQFQTSLPISEKPQNVNPHLWNVRPQTQSPQSPGGSQTNNMSYVQVVNSKTKTALANLLSNRLQGITGPESNAASASTSLTSTTSATQTMCPPPPPPVTSQSLPQSAPATSPSNILIQRRTLANLTNGSKTIQVNSFGGVARVTTSQASPTLPVAPSRPQFYGHDPQIKLPSDGWFLGCTFWAAIDVSLVDWKRPVTQHGGTIAEEYSQATVTHVICSNQKFPEFQQVLRDGKRIVTMYWLNDVHDRKMMVPPFYAIHLPTPFAENDKPMKEHVLSLSGFIDKDRSRVKAMCAIIGAGCTTYFTQFNTGLIANKAEGLKYLKAREWKKPVVSVQFLNEMLLGLSSSIQMIHSPKYQNFSVDQPFRFDIGLAPHLMAAWKIPIRVSSEMFEKFKLYKRPSDSEVEENPKKKIKLEIDPELVDSEPLSPLPDIVKVEPEEELAEIKSEILDSKLSPVVVTSGFTREFKIRIHAKVEKLGGKVTDDFKQATHLILKQDFVTTKLFLALCRLSFIVTPSWIYESLKVGKFVDEQLFTIRHLPFERQYGITIEDILLKPARQFLFKGVNFYMTPGNWLLKRDVEMVIEAAGGTIDRKQKSLKQIRDYCSRFPKRSVIITCEYDFQLMEDYFMEARRPHMINIYTDSFIWHCVATQKVKLRQNS